jgi:hypothetical protein
MSAIDKRDEAACALLSRMNSNPPSTIEARSLAKYHLSRCQKCQLKFGEIIKNWDNYN